MPFGQGNPTGNRRQFGRRQSNVHGWIKAPGRPAMPCVVRNLSEKGALLECEAPRLLPFRFELVMASSGVHYACEVRHCLDRAVGVTFGG